MHEFIDLGDDCPGIWEEVSNLCSSEIVDGIEDAEKDEDEDPFIVIFIVDEFYLAIETTLGSIVLMEEIVGIDLEKLLLM